MTNPIAAYETVIGLEVHAQLLTQSKLFCGCSTRFGAEVNANTCEVCLGMPGVLPVVNRRAVELACRAGFGLSCEVQHISEWSRKNYFYPDLAKGYQISQFERPIALRGKLAIEVGSEKKVIGITRIHMEEDAGKNVHDEVLAGHRSYVDFNRAGIGLVEIVSEPDLRSAEEAVAYLKALRQIVRYLGVCDGNMEEGSFRCDANVSIRPFGQAKFGTRVELKNINSFRFVQQAIDYEVLRQTQVLDSGGRVVQETRLWDTQAKVTRSMRSKEEAHDYRYFPDPDLPVLTLAPEFLEAIQQSLPELPEAKLQRYETTLGLSHYDAAVLTEDPDVANFFEQALVHHSNAKAIANWIINEVLREIKSDSIFSMKIGPKEVAELIALVDDGTISGKIAKDVFAEVLAEGGSPRALVEQRGLKQVTDAGAIEPIIDAIIAANQESAQKYREGKVTLLGFFVGQVMKATSGKANPQLVNELVRKKLS